MLYIYLVCLVVGGILLGGSLLLGAIHGSADADGSPDADGDADGGVEADHDAGAGEGGEHDHGGDSAGIWLPFLSIRFWVFTLSFFGLSGALLTLVGSGPVVTPILSVVVGLACGAGAAYAVHRIGKTGGAGRVASSGDFVGTVGTVLVSVGPGSRGRVRLEVHGQSVDLVARSTEGEALPAGSKALVLEYEEDVATVTPAPPEG